MSVTLGIDIGTSKVAAVLIDEDSKTPLAISSKSTNAEIEGKPSCAEQDVSQIISVVDQCVLALPRDQREQVAAIGVTGQMHGVLLWNSGSEKTSRLVTWQDRRCNDDGFLEELQRKTRDSTIKSGFGCATLAWYADADPSLLDQYSCASTIHDYFVCVICGLTHGITDPR